MRVRTAACMMLIASGAAFAQDQNTGALVGNVMAVRSEASNLYPETRYSIVLAVRTGDSTQRFTVPCASANGYPCWSIGWLAGCSWEYRPASSVSGTPEFVVFVASHTYQCAPGALGACVTTFTRAGFSSTGEQVQEVVSIRPTKGCASK